MTADWVKILVELIVIVATATAVIVSVRVTTSQLKEAILEHKQMLALLTHSINKLHTRVAVLEDRDQRKDEQ